MAANHSGKESGKEPLSNRRNFVKSIGAVCFAGSVVPSVSAAKERSALTPYEVSLKLRRQNDWSNETWTDYLSRKKEFTTGTFTKEAKKQVTTQGSGQEASDCVLYMTYTRPDYAGYDVIDFEWDYDNTGKQPPKPLNYAKIGFDKNHYSQPTSRSDWVYYGSREVSDPDKSNSKNDSGATATFDHYDASLYRQKSGVSDNFGVYVRPNWEDYDEYERQIWFRYIHTWNSAKIESIGVSNSGITITMESTSNQWDIESDGYEAQLVGRESVRGSN